VDGHNLLTELRKETPDSFFATSMNDELATIHLLEQELGPGREGVLRLNPYEIKTVKLRAGVPIEQKAAP